MKSSAENEITGKLHVVKGGIKKKVGRLVNDPGLEAQGIGEQITGKIQEKIGHVGRAIKKS
jgi:uncharacterized protein YjbJ (UPF0337 family)